MGVIAEVSAPHGRDDDHGDARAEHGDSEGSTAALGPAENAEQTVEEEQPKRHLKHI